MGKVFLYFRPLMLSRALTILCISFTAASSFAQQVKIIGRVTDSFNKQGLGGVSVINPKSNITQSTDNSGLFEVLADKHDTLFLFYPGYRTAKFSVSDSLMQPLYTLHLKMEPLSTGLDQAVIIRPKKDLSDIEKERKQLGVTPKELEKPVIDPFVNPISALYELLSDRAKEREKLRGQIEEDNRKRIFRELIRYYNENALMDLPEDHFEDFIRFCDLPLDFLKYSSDYEITKTILDDYHRYSRLSGLVK